MDDTEYRTTATSTVEPETEPVVEAEPAAGGAGSHEGVHLPPQSLWPITLAFAVTITASGLVTNWLVSVPGFLLLIWAIRGWVMELLHDSH